MTAQLERTRDAAVDACVQLVSRLRHGVSFVELASTCECLGIPAVGDAALWGTIPNVVLWAGMSDEFAAICEAVYRHPAVMLVAATAPLFDSLGACPPAVGDLPRASWPPRTSGYRTPHLLPIAFAWRTPLAGAPRTTTRKDHH